MNKSELLELEIYNNKDNDSISPDGFGTENKQHVYHKLNTSSELEARQRLTWIYNEVRNTISEAIDIPIPKIIITNFIGVNKDKEVGKWNEKLFLVDLENRTIKILADFMFRKYILWGFIKYLSPDNYWDIVKELDDKLSYVWIKDNHENNDWINN